jgi:hypothetical protein
MKMRPIAAALAVCAGMTMAFAQTTQPSNRPNTPNRPNAPTTPQAKQPEGMPSPEEMQKMMAEMAKPSEQITELNKQVNGTWNVEVKSWMAPNTPPMESKGTATFEPILGNKIIKQTFRGEFMGAEFRGEGVMAYHKAADKYQSTWMDSMSGTVMLSEGSKNDQGQLEFKDEYTCPMDGSEKTGRTLLTFESPTKMKMEMWTNTSDGQSFKAMELTYTKGAATPGGTRPTIETKPNPAPTARP